LEEYKIILRENNLEGKDVYPNIELSHSAYRNATMKSKVNPPRWVKAFVVAYNLGKKNVINNIEVNDHETVNVDS